jgi:hypothetical protein
MANLRTAAVLSMAVVVCLFLFHGDIEAEKETVVAEQLASVEHSPAASPQALSSDDETLLLQGCSDVHAAITQSQLEQENVSQVLHERHASVKTAKALLSSEQKAADGLERIRQEEHGDYLHLRKALQGELALVAVKAKQYSKLRARAIKADRYCSTHKVSVCSDGKRIEDTPDCHQVEKEDPTCGLARRLALRAAKVAPAVRHLTYIKAQLHHAQDEALLMAKEARQQLRDKETSLQQRRVAVSTASSLVQEAQIHHAKLGQRHQELQQIQAQLVATGHCDQGDDVQKNMIAEAPPRHPMTPESLKSLLGVLAAVKVLPSSPWKLSHKAKLHMEIEKSMKSIKAAEKSTAGSIASGLNAASSDLRKNDAVRSIAQELQVGQPRDTPWKYLRAAKESASKVDARELKSLLPGASTTELEKSSVQKMLKSMRLRDQSNRAKEQAMQRIKQAGIASGVHSSIMMEDGITQTVNPAQAAAMQQEQKQADADLAAQKAAQDKKLQQVAAKQKQKLANKIAQQKQKLQAVQDAAKAKPAQATGESDMAEKIAEAKRKYARQAQVEALQTQTRTEAIEKRGKNKMKRFKKRAKKQAKRREQDEKRDRKLAEGLPRHLHNTGYHDMVMSLERGSNRFDNHVRRARAAVLQLETRRLKRLQESSGGMAAIRVARRLRNQIRVDNAKYALETTRLRRHFLLKEEKLKRKQIRNQYKQAYESLRRKSEYVQELKKLETESKWRKQYDQAVSTAMVLCHGKAGTELTKCAKKQADDARPLAAHFRADDAQFQKNYRALQIRQKVNRMRFLNEKAKLQMKYNGHLRQLRKHVADKKARKEKASMYKNGADLGISTLIPESEIDEGLREATKLKQLSTKAAD